MPPRAYPARATDTKGKTITDNEAVHPEGLSDFPLRSLLGQDLDEHFVLLRRREPFTRLTPLLRFGHSQPPER